MGAHALAAVAAHDFHAVVQARSRLGSAEARSRAEFAGTHIPAAANDVDGYCSSSPFADEYGPAVAVDHVEGECSPVAAAEPSDVPVPAAATVAVVVVVAAADAVDAVDAVADAVFALIH